MSFAHTEIDRQDYPALDARGSHDEETHDEKDTRERL